MNIRVNFKDHSFEDINTINITDFMNRIKFTFPMIVIKLNDKVVKKEEYDTTFIKEGDHVQAIHLIGGG